MEYQWYELISDSSEIAQGDIIEDCPVVFIDKDNPVSYTAQDIKAEIKTIDVVVMSQACDLANGKVDYVILCGLVNVTDSGLGRSKLQEIIKGRQPAYHMIDLYKHETIEKDYRIVDFRNIYSLPLEQLKSIVQRQENRLRLLPPYREHLAQAFARYFMRIGLPININL